MGRQRGTLPVHTLGYVNSTKVIYRLALKPKGVFRESVSRLAFSAGNSIGAFPGQNKRADILSDSKWGTYKHTTKSDLMICV